MKKPIAIILLIASTILTSCGDRPAGSSAAPEARPETVETAAATPLSDAEIVAAWIAAATGDIDTVKSALARGLDVNDRDPNSGGAILIGAAFAGQTEIVKALLEKKPDLEAKNNEGGTALFNAAFFCHPETLDALIEAGAAVNAKNKNGATALDAATSPWTPEIAGIYKFIGGVLQMEFDLDRIQKTRPKIADILEKHGGKKAAEL